MSRHILFTAAGLNLAVPASSIKAIHESLRVQPVVGTLDWFLGLSVANGRLLPVTDLGSFLGCCSSKGRTLELESDVAVVALKVDDVSGVSEVHAQNTDADSTDAAAMTKYIKLTGQTVSDKGGLHQVLDLPALVQSFAFVNIKEQ